MKRTFYIFTLLLMLFGNLKGQSINDLDTKNGFKDFSIGDDLAKWQSSIRAQGTWDDGTPIYVYYGSCCNMVFQYPVELIRLRFMNNKLAGIFITLEKFQKEYSKSNQYTTWRKDDFTSINNSFELLFGIETEIKPDEKTGDISYVWLGKKITLISTYKYLGVQYGDQQNVTIFSNDYLDSSLKKGF